MNSSIVAQWLDSQFQKLHPLLQRLHESGGQLSGPAEVGFGPGMAGWLGRRLARRLGLPTQAGPCLMEVAISQDKGCLVWARRFSLPGEPPRTMVSVFQPQGQWPTGHWLEHSGAMQFKLGVDVREGGWYWRVLGARLHGVPLPVKLLPQSYAYKRIEDGRYRFEVMYAAPLLGPLLWYRGLLQLSNDARPIAPSSPAGNPHL
jgi:hypothetical protein